MIATQNMVVWVFTTYGWKQNFYLNQILVIVGILLVLLSAYKSIIFLLTTVFLRMALIGQFMINDLVSYGLFDALDGVTY